MEPTPHILVIDDDREIRDLLARFLEKQRMRVTAVRDGREARRAWLNGHYQLVVLDLMLPGESGLDLARWLRTESDIPIVMLTAMGEDTDRIIGLELGADDYVPKPFSLDELIARIRVQLRRQAPGEGSVVEAGRLRVDLARRQAVLGDRVADLSDREFRLLHHLVLHAGEIVSRERLLSEIWGYHFDPGSNVVDVCIRRLRKKLGADAVETVRHAGYRVAAA
jgi:two-component system, OmpR family, response regulator